MAAKILTHKEIGLLSNGEAGAVIDRALQLAVDDLEDRGADDGKPRKVIIEIELMRGPQGTVVAFVGAQAKTPPRRTNPHIGKIVHHPEEGFQLMFQEFAAEDPNQMTIDEMERRARAADGKSAAAGE